VGAKLRRDFGTVVRPHRRQKLGTGSPTIGNGLWSAWVGTLEVQPGVLNAGNLTITTTRPAYVYKERLAPIIRAEEQRSIASCLDRVGQTALGMCSAKSSTSNRPVVYTPAKLPGNSAHVCNFLTQRTVSAANMLSAWTQPEDQRNHSKSLSVWCRSYGPKGQENLARPGSSLGLNVLSR
jgi:hypothetical protein